MPYVSKEQIAKAKQWDLLTYLQTYDPNELVKASQNEFYTRTHDSLRISTNGKWNWCSRGFGGKTALDYLVHVQGMDFPSAVLHLCGEHVQLAGQTSLPPPKHVAAATKEKKPFALPVAYHDNRRVFDYLTGRCIEKEIIQTCIHVGIIYESKAYHNCIFVGHDEFGAARHASQRGTFGNFKNDIESSDKSYGFFLPAAEQPCTVLAVFESAIDALSHATLRYMEDPLDWSNINRLSSSGTNEIPIRQYLSTHPETKKIFLCYDNDAAGLERRMPKIKENLQKDYSHLEITIDPPPRTKDYNAYLKSIAPQKRRDFDLERG